VCECFCVCLFSVCMFACIGVYACATVCLFLLRHIVLIVCCPTCWWIKFNIITLFWMTTSEVNGRCDRTWREWRDCEWVSRFFTTHQHIIRYLVPSQLLNRTKFIWDVGGNKIRYVCKLCVRSRLFSYDKIRIKVRFFDSSTFQSRLKTHLFHKSFSP